MTNETRDDAREQSGRPVPPAAERPGRRLALGATVTIPPRARCAPVLGPATLHARLALLRPQPVRLKPAVPEH